MRVRRLVFLAAAGSMVGAMVGVARPVAAATPATFSINSVSVLEGNGPGSSSVITFTVTLANAAPGVNYSALWKTTPVTASEAPSGSHCNGTKDYVQQLPSALATMNTVFPSEQISVTTCADNVHEPDETFDVVLFNPTTGAQIGTGTGVGTLLDDDTAPNVTIPNASVSEPAAPTLVTIPVDVSAPNSSAITFNWSTVSAGSAIAGTACAGTVDYVTATGQVHVPANATTPDVPLRMTICHDASLHSNKSFKLHFTNYSAGVSGQTGDAVVTITAASVGKGLYVDDAPPVSEHGGTASFKIELIGLNPTQRASISYQLFDNGRGAKGGSSCSAGIDYVTQNSSVVLNTGKLSVTVNVHLCDDALDENDEGFDLVVKGASGYAVVDNVGHATILDDDGPPTLSLAASRAQLEGNSGTTTMSLVWVLASGGHTQASAKTITFKFDTSDISGAAHGGNCGTAGVDFQSLHRTVTIPAGAKVGAVAVKICGDTTSEAAESFAYVASNFTNALVGNRAGTGTIQNDDGAALSISAARTNEGNSRQRLVALTVKFPSAAPKAGALSFALGGTSVKGTGSSCLRTTAGADYLQSTSSPVPFAAGARSVLLRFTICGDTRVEPSEVITATVTNADWFRSGARGTLTIVNDD